MGQKSNPIGLRLQINRTWDSRWYAEGRDYAGLLKEDIEMRKYICAQRWQRQGLMAPLPKSRALPHHLPRRHHELRARHQCPAPHQ